MTTKADFTDEEWTRLERAPLVAGMAISFADPGGPIEALKESMAAVKTIVVDSSLPAVRSSATRPATASSTESSAASPQR